MLWQSVVYILGKPLISSQQVTFIELWNLLKSSPQFAGAQHNGINCRINCYLVRLKYHQEEEGKKGSGCNLFRCHAGTVILWILVNILN